MVKHVEMEAEVSEFSERVEANNSDARAWAQVELDGGELSTGALPTPLNGDWNAVLRSFGLDPDVFEFWPNRGNDR